MNLSTLLDLWGLVLGLFSAWMFCFSAITVKKESLSIIAFSQWEKGSENAKGLAEQKVDFIFGAILLALSFILQIPGKIWPGCSSIVAASSPQYGAALGFAAPAVVLLLLYIPWHRYRRQAAKSIEEEAKTKG